MCVFVCVCVCVCECVCVCVCVSMCMCVIETLHAPSCMLCFYCPVVYSFHFFVSTDQPQQEQVEISLEGRYHEPKRKRLCVPPSQRRRGVVVSAGMVC